MWHGIGWYGFIGVLTTSTTDISLEMIHRLVRDLSYTPIVFFFADRFKAGLLLWIFVVACVSCCLVCFLQPFGHLLG